MLLERPWLSHADWCVQFGVFCPIRVVLQGLWKDARLTHFGCVAKPWRVPAKPDPGCGGETRRRWRDGFDAAIERSMLQLSALQNARTKELVELADTVKAT